MPGNLEIQPSSELVPASRLSLRRSGRLVAPLPTPMGSRIDDPAVNTRMATAKNDSPC